MRFLLAAWLSFVLVPAFAQKLPATSHPRVRGITIEQFSSLAAHCVPNAPLSTLRAITRAESGFYPLAVSINYPEHSAARRGFKHSRIVLHRQPASFQEARRWIAWLERNGYTVSVGLMQVNLESATFYGVDSGELLDPCMNLRIGWGIFLSKYEQALEQKGNSHQILKYALSLYNSGSPSIGFNNGYVNRVTGEGFQSKQTSERPER